VGKRYTPVWITPFQLVSSLEIPTIGYSGTSPLSGILAPVSSPADSIEDRIRMLCARVVSAPESESGPIVSELKSLLHEHVTRARELAVASFPQKKDDAA
jgi:hypothetical protein